MKNGQFIKLKNYGHTYCGYENDVGIIINLKEISLGKGDFVSKIQLIKNGGYNYVFPENIIIANSNIII